jgi:tRNA/tmRNA/rRNA uracil-C5-methylase (TrmA/RlmC/RlmD family)
MADVDDELVEGDRVEVTVGAPAHGGHCVARIGGPHGRVVFVRHALPGERVTAEITELHRSYLRADAVEIHQPAPDRVTPPCPYAHPGGCGGCDLQHVADGAQLDWKTAVVREQLARPGGLTETQINDLSVRVQPLPGGTLGWRSRVRYAVDAAGRPGLLQHRSHQVVPIDRCRIAHPSAQALDLTGRLWPNADAIEVVASTGGDVSVLIRPAGSASSGSVSGGSASSGSASSGSVSSGSVSGGSAWAGSGSAGSGSGGSGSGGSALGGSGSGDSTPTGDLLSAGDAHVLMTGPAEVLELAAGRRWRIPPDAFWQVHPAAADTLVAAVLELLQPAPGEIGWDLYGGAGLFAAAVAERTGARMTIVESSPAGVATARSNLADLGGVEVVAARVDVALARRRVTGPVDLVVLDPPRTGAGGKVVRAIAAARPRAVAYVACDPAAFARDVATFAEAGWRLAELRAYDCFPMTQHIECVGLLLPIG